MRILMTATFSFPEGTLGASRALHMQAKGLSEAGHEVLVATCRGSLGSTREVLDGFAIRSFALVTGESRGLRRSVSWLNGQVRMLLFLLEAIRKRTFDDIVFYGPAPVFALAAIAGRARGQRMTYIQGDLLNPRGKPLHALAELALARSASLIVVGGSSLLAAHLGRLAPATRQVKLWPPTDADYFAEGNAARARASLRLGDAPLVVYAGAVSSLDGVDLLIRSMKSVVARIPDARLVIAGFILKQDPIVGEPLQYSELVTSLGLQESIVLAGSMPMRDVADLFAAASVLVNPKVPHLTNQMAAPIKIGEYLAAGRPVLTTKECELEAWLGDGREVLFYNSGDPEALSAGICELMTNTELASRLSREGARVARRVCDYRAWGTSVAEAMMEVRNEA